MNTEKSTVRLRNRLWQPRLTPFWCVACVRLVTMISSEEVAFILRTNIEDLGCQIQTRRLHWIKTTTGKLMICKNSLF
jgi:hypothetical protein